MIYYLLVILLSLTPPLVHCADVTKICGNEDCSEVLYTATVTRPYVSDHEGFLTLEVNEPLQIYAIKFSNRVDIIEGVSASGKRGLIYKSMVDAESLVFWLFSVVKQNLQVYEVLNTAQPGFPKPLKIKNANPLLLRDYMVNARNAGMDPEDIPELEDPDKVKKGHHHHHHHHGHDHHDHDHSHEHEHPAPPAPTTAAPPVAVPEQAATPPPATPPPPPVPAADPLKKISLDAMAKGAAIPPQQPQPVKTPQSGTVDDLKKRQIAEAFAAAQQQAKIAAAQEQANAAKIAQAQAEANAAKIAQAQAEANAAKIAQAQAEAIKQSQEAAAAEAALKQAQQNAQNTLPVEPEVAANVVQDTPPLPVESESASPVTPPIQPLEAATPVAEPAQIEEASIPVEPLPTPTLNDVVTPPPGPVETITATPVVAEPSVPPVPTPDIYNSIIDTIEQLPTTPPTPLPNEEVPADPQPSPVVTPAPVAEELPTPAPLPATPPSLPVQYASAPTPAPELPTVTPPSIAESAETTTTPAPIAEEVPATTTTTPAPLSVEPEVVATPAPVPLPEPPVKPDTIPNEDEVRQRRSTLQDGIDKPDDFCYNNDCSGRVGAAEALSPNDPASRPVNTGFFATTIRPTFKSISVAIRSSLPYPISHFDDTGVFVLLNLLLAILVYVIIWLSADARRPDVLDRRALHDALSRIKEQENHIQQLQANASDPAVIVQYTREIENLRNANSALTAQLNSVTAAHQHIEAELAEANSERATYQAELQSANSDKADLQNKHDAVASENASLKADLTFVQQQLEEANTRSADYIAELQDVQKTVRELETAISEEKDAKSALEASFDRLKETITSLEKQLEAKNHSNLEYADMVAELNEQKKALERQVVAFEEKLAASAGSGGAGSDGPEDVPHAKSANDTAEVVDESDVKPKKPVKVATLGKKAATPKPPTPKESSPEVENSRKTSVSHVSIEAVMEMKALRDTLRDIKVECDNLKRELATEQRSRESIEAALDESRKNLAEKKAELEKAIANFDKCSAKNDQLHQLNTDMYRKTERLEEQCATIPELKESISALTFEKAGLSNRIKDLEKQLKKAEERAENLERLRYLDERKFKEKVAELEDRLTKVKVAQPVVNDGIGSGNSSDRDFSITNVSSSAVASLWDNVDDPETSFDSNPNIRSNGSRRRSDRFLPPVEPSGRRSVGRRPEGHSSTTHRYRSRSAGRQRYAAASPYDEVPSGSDRYVSRTSPHYDEYGRDRPIGASAADLRLRRSTNGRRSTNFVYSSDGSGACSPPPELASESGVPPATIKIHKPAPKK
uniref:WH1 domain-containing protein n=1 Tax=Panagrellus redivivus TaxID=6233 RepID=A0A7E4WCM2_PANRE